MITIQIPQFDYDLKFTGFKEIKIKNKPDTLDYNKVCEHLPGLTVGYCPAIYKIKENKKPIEIIHFYDIRQKGIKKLKGFYITIKLEKK